MGRSPASRRAENVHSESAVPDRADTLVIGLVALDTVCKFASEPAMGDSNPGSIALAIGGVGFNVSLAHKYGLTSQKVPSTVRFVSAVGDDISGVKVVEEMGKLGLDTTGIKVIKNLSTAQYTACLDNKGELVVACADMTIVEKDALVNHSVAELERARPRFVVLDCNLLPKCIEAILLAVSKMEIRPRVVIEPTSKPKLARISEINSALLSVFPNNNILLVTPTVDELLQMYSSFSNRELFDDYDGWFPLLDSLGINAEFRDKMNLSKNPAIKALLQQGVLQQAFLLLPYIPNVLVKLGNKGCVLVMLTTSADDYRSIPTTSPHKPLILVSHGRQLENDQRLGVVVEYYDIPPENRDLEIVNVTGAGDSLLGYLSSALAGDDWLGHEVVSLEQEWDRWRAVYNAQLASGTSLASNEAISSQIRHIDG